MKAGGVAYVAFVSDGINLQLEKQRREFIAARENEAFLFEPQEFGSSALVVGCFNFGCTFLGRFETASDLFHTKYGASSLPVWRDDLLGHALPVFGEALSIFRKCTTRRAASNQRETRLARSNPARAGAFARRRFNSAYLERVPFDKACRICVCE